MAMATLDIRFYEELNDFLPADRQKETFPVPVTQTQTVKDVIEACGVPHVEVDLILVDGVSVSFDYRPHGAIRVAVYPMFESVDVTSVQRLRPRPLRRPRFIIDANLGRLARLLRLLGLDCKYDPTIDDAELAERSADETLTLLTRDRRLLMRRVIDRGYYVRSQDPPIQAAEVISRFDLAGLIDPLTRCTACNGVIAPVEKHSVLHLLPIKTRLYIDRFRQCSSCSKVFWKGAHWPRVEDLIRRIVHSSRYK